MLMLKRLIAFVVTGVTFIAAGGVAWAGLGQPSPWELGLQQSASPVMDDVVWFHNFLLWLIAAIALFVLALLAIVVVKFNARANPVPSRTTHNTAIEIIWTVVPVLILVTVAVPSFRLLFYQLKVPPADVTVKVTGKQWFWSYCYPDSKFEFDSLMVQDKDLKPGQLRLLSVDNEMVVPVNKVVRVQVTGADVIHSFSVPSFGIKIDAIPGPPQRDLVQGGTGRHVLRTMLAALRPRSRLHADRRPRREREGIHRLARAGEEEIRRRYTSLLRMRLPRPTRRSDTYKNTNIIRATTKRVEGQQRWLTTRLRTAHTTPMMPTITIPPDGAGSSIRRTTKTSAPCT